MQLSEQQKDALLRLEDEAGQSFKSKVQVFREDLVMVLNLVGFLRAQADARPHVATVRYSRDCDGDWHATAIFNGEVPEEGTKLYTHPEASAPGLIDQAIAICQEEGDEWDSDRVQATKNYAHACRDRIRVLTSTSAQPSSAQVPVLDEFEIRDLAVKYCAYETDGKCYNIVRYEIEEDFFNFCRALISLALTRASAATVAEPKVAERMALLDNVCRYADSICGMLREGGWPGKAEALEARIKAVVDFDADQQT